MNYPTEFRLDGQVWNVEYTMNEGSQANRKQFIQRIYNKYVNIRQIAGGNKCRKMSKLVLFDKLKDPSIMLNVTTVLGYNEEEINLIMAIADQEIPFIK